MEICAVVKKKIINTLPLLEKSNCLSVKMRSTTGIPNTFLFVTIAFFLAVASDVPIDSQFPENNSVNSKPSALQFQLPNNYNPPLDTALALRQIDKGLNRTILGNLLFFGGLGLQFMVMNSTYGGDASQAAGFTAFIAASLAVVSGPFVSYVGGDITKKGIRLCIPSYPNHTGWRDFAISSSLGLITAMVLLADDSSPSTTTSVIAIGTGITSFGFYVKSVLGPWRYSRRAKTAIGISVR